MLKSSDHALFYSMQQKMHRCHMKGVFQCPRWRFFQSNEKISQKSIEKNLWTYFLEKKSSIIQIPRPFGKDNTWPNFDTFISKPAPALPFRKKIDEYWRFSLSWRFWPIYMQFDWIELYQKSFWCGPKDHPRDLGATF